MVVAITGCVNSLTIMPYSPSIPMEGTGNIKVGDFKYIPSQNGTLANNQVDMGPFSMEAYTDTEIKDYVAGAVAKELKFIGYKLNQNSKSVISGDILEFSGDFRGFKTLDVKVRIEFKISSNEDGKVSEVYKKIHEGSYSISKWTFAEPSFLFHEGLRNCIKNFISDAQKEKIL